MPSPFRFPFSHLSATLHPSHGFQGSQDRQQHNSSEQPKAQNGTETWIFSCLLLGPALQKLLRENQHQGGAAAAGGCSTPPWSASPISLSRDKEGQHRKSKVLHEEPWDAVADTFPIKSSLCLFQNWNLVGEQTSLSYRNSLGCCAHPSLMNC